MDSIFPFGFPFPTAFYLTFYVLTLVIHVIFMNYVLAGAGYLAVVTVFPGRGTNDHSKSPVALILRDWMPFAVSAAITAGVAPLLFIQILYKHNFYTANLLLFHRWMAIVPVLIVGFYLTYLLKSKAIERWHTAARILVGVGAFLCFLFAAYSWTENHVLSTDRATWPDFYASDAIVYKSGQMLPRLLLWALGAIPTMCVLVAWQLHMQGGRMDAKVAFAEPRGGTGSNEIVGDVHLAPEARRLAILAFTGIILSGAAGVLYYAMMEGPAPQAVRGSMALPYLIAAAVGLACQLAAWHFIFHRRGFTSRLLALASAGVLLTVIGATVVREAVRLSAVNVEAYYEQHEQAAQVGGLITFLVFFAINAVLIAWCFRLVKRNAKKMTDDQ